MFFFELRMFSFLNVFFLTHKMELLQVILTAISLNIKMQLVINR